MLYRVRVKIDNLLIRTGPGKEYARVPGYASGEYDVFEERNGYGRVFINRWIALEYTERVGEGELSIEERITRLEKAVFGD